MVVTVPNTEWDRRDQERMAEERGRMYEEQARQQNFEHARQADQAYINRQYAKLNRANTTEREQHYLNKIDGLEANFRRQYGSDDSSSCCMIL